MKHNSTLSTIHGSPLIEHCLPLTAMQSPSPSFPTFKSSTHWFVCVFFVCLSLLCVTDALTRRSPSVVAIHAYLYSRHLLPVTHHSPSLTAPEILIASQSLYNRFTIALQSLCNRFVIASQLLRYRFVIALQSL